MTNGEFLKLNGITWRQYLARIRAQHHKFYNPKLYKRYYK